LHELSFLQEGSFISLNYKIDIFSKSKILMSLLYSYDDIVWKTLDEVLINTNLNQANYNVAQGALTPATLTGTWDLENPFGEINSNTNAVYWRL
jgi:hypothetical protein